MRYKKPILISIVAHILLLALLTKGRGDGNENGGTKVPHDNIVVKIIDKPDEKIKEDKPIDGKLLVKKIKKKKPKKKIKEVDCPDFYIGIGVDHAYGSCLVTGVHSGYPADVNGVQVGDLIISPPCEQIRSPSISRIDLTILRGTQAIHLSFMRGKICGTK